MKIVIVGVGSIGFNVAEKLRKENHDVIIIETNEERIRQIAERVDALVISGNGTDPLVLERARVRGADMFLAVTDSDESNILSCLVAGRFNIAHKLARISNPDYFHATLGLNAAELGIDSVIKPQEVCAVEVYHLLKNRSIFEMIEIHEGAAQLVGFRVGVDNPLVGKTLAEFSAEMVIESIRVVAISRSGRIIIPYGKDSLELGDEVYIMGRKDSIPEFLELCNLKNAPLKRVVVAGGTQAAASLAGQLEGDDVELRIIEPDRARAEKLSEQLNKALVIAGDPSEVSSLKEAGIDRADAFVALSDDDEDNIVSCVLAKDLGAKRTIVSIKKVEYVGIVSNIVKIDSTVSTRLATINAVLRFVRRGKVVSATELHGLAAEVMEMLVTNEAGMHGKKIRDLKFPKNAIIGIVIRGTQVLPAIGGLKLQEGDRAVVLAVPEAIAEVERFFSRKRTGLF